jgi:FAD/FMN-containing dehydrogenase
VSTNVLIKKSGGGQASIAPDAVDGLRAQLRGALCLPGDEGYDKARTLWNAMIDRKPALIVRAQGASDVMAAVNFARANGLLVAVKGGGHNIAGNACCDGGLMIDLSQMKSVRVDARAKRARVEPGALLSDLDRETGAFGLATPLGINSTTGVAGLTLGGGFGWTSRKFGLTVDNLASADVVTADGKLVTASENENADLFWAIRGGGGNFGIVTSFEFKLHEVANVLRGPHRLPVRGREGVVREVPRLRGQGARRADGVGRAAQGAAPAVPAHGVARQGGLRDRVLLERRPRKG